MKPLPQGLEPCPHCKGTGFTESLIEGTTYRCHNCAGTRGIPRPGAGPFYFYQPINWRYGYLTQRVAIVTPEEDGRYRVTLYGPDGPHMHSHEKREEAFGQLHGYRMTDLARRILDTWPRTEVWAKGMRAIDEVERFNAQTWDW